MFVPRASTVIRIRKRSVYKSFRSSIRIAGDARQDPNAGRIERILRAGSDAAADQHIDSVGL